MKTRQNTYNLNKKIFLLLVLLFSAYSSDAANVSQLDLKDWNLSEKPILQLDCEWDFYANRLIDPEEFFKSEPEPTSRIHPSSWNKETNGGNTGCATYRLIIKNIPSVPLTLDAYSVQTASRVFVNGKLVAEIGKVGIDKESTSPENRDVQIRIPENVTQLELVVQIANFHHRKGGFVHPFELGLAPAIEKQRLMYYILDSVESSALAIIGFFLLALFVFRRKDMPALYFALFCITLSFRPVISVNYLLGTLFPDMSWFLLIRIEYLAVLFPCLFMLLFVKKLFPKQLPTLFVQILKYILLLKIAITLFFPPAVFSWLVLPLLVIIPVGVIMFTITIIRAVLANVEGANYAGMGIILLFASLILKVMVYAGIIPAVHVLITVMDIGFIFMMSLILGSRFSLQFVKVETLQLETELQRHEIELKKEQVEKQKELVEEKNKEILDSITYAKRIQDSILPSEKRIRQFFPESFVLYKPKDIVAGDFYWMEQSGDTIFIAVADCTGHGVPGALVSVVCCNALNRTVKEFGINEPGKILDKVRALVLETFEKGEDDVKDGMDISLCAFNANTKTLEWAGANNPLWMIQKGELKEIKADKQPVGKTEFPQPFITHRVHFEKGDSIFLFTDGYADQFGGPKGKKFRQKQMQELILSIYPGSSAEQKKALNDAIEKWRNWNESGVDSKEMEQVDDICVIGIKL